MTVAMMVYSAFLLWLISLLTIAYRIAKAFDDFRSSKETISSMMFDSLTINTDFNQG